MAETDQVPRPVEAMEYLSRKANVKTESWDDLKWGEHSHAFTVAHSMEGAVADKMHELLNKAMANGESYGSFRKNALTMMKEENWYGGAGHTKDEKAYISWRLRVIYDTNMKTAFEAGRYRQQMRHAEMRPIWEYVSKLVGKNRRDDHIALHGKAFRFDDPFWKENYPPNGWGCECSVITLSESGAEREGVEVLKSDSNGNPPAMVDRNGNAVDWKNFAPKEWKYNPGLEALAPSFGNYKKLAESRMPDGKSVLFHVVERYRQDMDETRITESEFKILLDKVQQVKYKPNDIPLQIGNLDQQRHKAMLEKAKIMDSKIMASTRKLRHGTLAKDDDQKVKPYELRYLYQIFSSPEHIFERDEPKSPHLGREFHFVKDTHDGKVIRLVFRQQGKNTSLNLTTISKVEDEYAETANSQYTRIF
jgi:SPP1 gp7 family putative phage head morphogenesis protein